MGALKPRANLTALHLAPFRYVFFQDAHFPFYCTLYSSLGKNHPAPIWDLSDYTAKTKQGTGSARNTGKVLQDVMKHWKLSEGTALFTQIPGWFRSLSRGITCIVRRALSLGQHHLIDYRNNYQPKKGRKYMPHIFEKGAVDGTREQRFGRRRTTTLSEGFS